MELLDLEGHVFAKVAVPHGDDLDHSEFHAFPCESARERWVASPRRIGKRSNCPVPAPRTTVCKHPKSRHLDGIRVYIPNEDQDVELCPCIRPLAVKAWAHWVSKLGVGGVRPFRVLEHPRKNWEYGDLVSAADMNKLEELVESYKRYALLGPLSLVVTVVLWLVRTFVLTPS